MTAPNIGFHKLFDMEIQNRAFAHESVEALGTRAATEVDKMVFADWLAIEVFLQRAHAPTVQKHGLSQKIRWQARVQSRLARIASAVLPDRMFAKVALDGTERHLEKMRDLYKVAPDEDKTFFDFVVRQEQVQVDALKLRVEGKKREAAQLLADFTSSHESDFP